MKKSVIVNFSIPLAVLAVFTVVFRLTNLDIAMERLFYTSEQGWFLAGSNPWQLLYNYGNLPGVLLALVAIFALAIGFFSRRVSRYRKIALFLVLLIVIGPGLITNALLKDQWGRPRPRQIEAFGGKETFLPVWVKGVAGARKSFPSGHASVGYFLMAPFFFLRNTAKRWAYLLLLMGLGYGTLMGIGRMIQGAHFASDIIWAWGVTYLTGLSLYYILRLYKTIWWTSASGASEVVSGKDNVA